MIGQRYPAILPALLMLGCSNNVPSEEQIESTFDVYTGSDQVSVTINENMGYASATGVWTVEGDDKIKDTVNVSNIFCTRTDGFCEDRRAWISSGYGAPTLISASDHYSIDSWTPKRITARLTDQCRTIELRLSTEDNSVTTITSNAAGCGDLPKPRLSRLISGAELRNSRK